MKKLLFSLLILVSDRAFSQDCNAYHLFTNNASMEMTITDKKGELTGTVQYKVLSVSGGESKVTTTNFDKKGKEIVKGEGIYRCVNGAFSVDMKAMIPAEQQSGFKNMTMKLSDSYISYPNRMSVGETLPENELTGDAFIDNMRIMGINLKVTNRKVEAKESVTTPAGTWDCYKITSTINMKTVMSFTIDAIEWFAPNIGVIKTESYRKGSLMGGTMITKLQK